MKVVGATGFEPATPCPPCRCATGLRYAPTKGRRIYATRSIQRKRPRANRNEIRPLPARARPTGSRPDRLPILELREQLLQIVLDLAEDQLALGVDEAHLDLRLGFLLLVLDLLPRALDREAALVEQLADAEEDLQVLGPIDTVPGAVLPRLQDRELGFPVAQDVG